VGIMQVKSSHIETVEYDEVTKVLTIMFYRGTYQYSGVPKEVYDEMLGSKTLGTYFHFNIKGLYECKKMR
jgi:hypothetical protein